MFIRKCRAVCAAAILLIFQGCMSQPVSVNAFLSPATAAAIAVNKDAGFAVIPNDRVPNPIFDRIVRDKIEYVLSQKSFKVSAPEEARYRIHYAYDLEGQSTSRRGFFAFPGFQSMYVTGGSGYDSYVGGGLGFGTFLPSGYNVYSAKLRITVTRPRMQGAPGEEEVLWVGESVTETDSPDLRKMVNYLLAAVFRYFLQDSIESKTVKLSKKNDEIKSLSGIPTPVQKQDAGV